MHFVLSRLKHFKLSNYKRINIFNIPKIILRSNKSIREIPTQEKGRNEQSSQPKKKRNSQKKERGRKRGKRKKYLIITWRASHDRK